MIVSSVFSSWNLVYFRLSVAALHSVKSWSNIGIDSCVALVFFELLVCFVRDKKLLPDFLLEYIAELYLQRFRLWKNSVIEPLVLFFRYEHGSTVFAICEDSILALVKSYEVHPFAILRKSLLFCVQELVVDNIPSVTHSLENRTEKIRELALEDSLHILKNEVFRLFFFEHSQKVLDENSAATCELLPSSDADILAGKTSSE